jgi:hypothetical protein
VETPPQCGVRTSLIASLSGVLLRDSLNIWDQFLNIFIGSGGEALKPAFSIDDQLHMKKERKKNGIHVYLS